MGTKKPHKLEGPRIGFNRSERKGVSASARREIGKQLKSLYDEVVNEPVPDRLTKLLGELENRTPPKKDEGEQP